MNPGLTQLWFLNLFLLGNQSDKVVRIQLTFPFPVINVWISQEATKIECIFTCRYDFRACHIVSLASSPGRRLVQAMWLCRGLGQAWRLSAAKGVEKSKSKIKNGSSKNWSSKGKIRKDPCLSYNENHVLCFTSFKMTMETGENNSSFISRCYSCCF